MFYQVHERHGKHIAYSTDEVKRNELAGWKTVSEDEFYGKKKTAPSSAGGDQAKPEAVGKGGKKTSSKSSAGGDQD